MDNLVGWAIILGGLYLFVPVVRREINGWIVKLSDRVKNDTDIRPIEPTQEFVEPEATAVEEVALLLYEIDFPPPPGAERGWHDQVGGMRSHYRQRARDRLNGVVSDPADVEKG